MDNKELQKQFKERQVKDGFKQKTIYLSNKMDKKIKEYKKLHQLKNDKETYNHIFKQFFDSVDNQYDFTISQKQKLYSVIETSHKELIRKIKELKSNDNDLSLKDSVKEIPQHYKLPKGKSNNVKVEYKSKQQTSTKEVILDKGVVKIEGFIFDKKKSDDFRKNIFYFEKKKMKEGYKRKDIVVILNDNGVIPYRSDKWSVNGLRLTTTRVKKDFNLL